MNLNQYHRDLKLIRQCTLQAELIFYLVYMSEFDSLANRPTDNHETSIYLCLYYTG